MQWNYLKTIFEGVWHSNFQESGQVKFVKFLNSVGLNDMMVLLGPRGLLNSRNYWIDDRKAYQSLLRSLRNYIHYN